MSLRVPAQPLRYQVLITAFLLSCLVPAASASAQRFAISIGNNRGNADEEHLRWAEDDARRTQQLLHELGDVNQDDAQLVIDGSADDVRRAVRALRERVAHSGKPQAAVLFAYYSGHGDAENLHLSGSLLPLRELASLLREVQAATVVTIVDACRTEFAPGVRSKGARHGPAFDIRMSAESGPAGRVTITSAGRDEIAQESDSLRGSFFTHHLLSGMRGAADSDGDHLVRLDELYRYAYHHTLASSHAQLASVQHPQLAVELQGEGDLIITRLLRAQALLELSPGIAGDVMIVDDGNGEVVAQLYKPAGSVTQVALNPGRFRVQARSGAGVFAGEIGLEWGGRQTLQAHSLAHQEFDATLAKGQRFDPQQALLFVGARTGLAAAVSSASFGGAVRAAWDVTNLRLLTELQLAHANADNPTFSRSYLETRLGLGIAPRFALAPAQLLIGVTGGLLWVHERATRLAQSEVLTALHVPRNTAGNTLGPYLAPLLGFELPLGSQLIAAVQAELQLALLQIDRRLALRPLPNLAVSVGRRF